jgi:5-methyltetrahydropteroyltriglutamate--homocysteine methyltransferase
MLVPTEPIGSIPRPPALMEAVAARGDGNDPTLDPLYDAAIRDTIEPFEATGSPVITDAEQRKYHVTIPRQRARRHLKKSGRACSARRSPQR